MSTRQARITLRNARHDYLAARLHYLAALKVVERLVYRKDDPALLRKQA